MPLYSIRSKLLIYTLVAVLSALLLGSYLVDRGLMSYHRQAAEEQITRAVTEFHQELDQLSVTLAREAGVVLSEQRFVASVNLINRFRQLDNYQPILFDVEKHAQADRLLTAVQTGHADEAFVYTLDEHLSAVAYAADTRYITAIQTWREESPLLLLRHAGESLHDPVVRNRMITRAQLHQRNPVQGISRCFNGREFRVEHHAPIYRNLPDGEQQAQGRLVLAKRITPALLDSLVRGGVQVAFMDDELKRGEGFTQFPDLNQGLTPAQRHALPMQSPQIVETDMGMLYMERLSVNSDCEAYLALLYPIELYQASLNTTRQATLLASLVAALIILPLSILMLQRQLGAPLSQLMSGVQRIRAGNFDQNVELKRRDELGQLAQAMNQMADAVNQREKHLKQANQELEQLGQVMAHHFQEPVRRLKIFSERLQTKKDFLDDEDALTSLTFIQSQSDRLSLLVRNVQKYLELSRVKPQPEWVDTENLLKELLTSVEWSQRLERSAAEVRVFSPLPRVWISPRRLKEVFEVLLGNALLYDRPDRSPRIEVSGQRYQDRIQLIFADNGQGISDSYREQVFDLFKRLVSNQQYPGIGMGLTLARRILQQVDASIHVEDGLDGGAAFVMTFALKEPKV